MNFNSEKQLCAGANGSQSVCHTAGQILRDQQLLLSLSLAHRHTHTHTHTLTHTHTHTLTHTLPHTHTHTHKHTHTHTHTHTHSFSFRGVTCSPHCETPVCPDFLPSYARSEEHTSALQSH